jgi:hypothetical protein
MGINKKRLFTRDIFDAVTLEVRLRLWDATFNVHSDTTVPSEQHIVFLIHACRCFAHRADRWDSLVSSHRYDALRIL